MADVASGSQLTASETLGEASWRRVWHQQRCCACREALETPGPYLLDVMVPHIQHVLPMIPGGGSFKEVITTGDGLDTY